MKAKKIIRLLVCSLTSILISCSESWPYSEDAYNNTWIEVDPSYISLNEDEFSGEFTVNSSESWYVYDSSSWINISSSYGYGYDNVSFTVDENDGSSSRYGYIKIRTDEGFTKEAEVEVSQPPTVQFEASMSTTNYKADGDYWWLEVKASASKSWTITKSDSWVHLGNSYNSSYTYNGRGNEEVKIYVDANTSSYSRSSTLTVKCGTKTKSIAIFQEKATNGLTVNPSSVTLDWMDTTNFGSFEITSSTSWRITKSSNASWLTVSPTVGSGNSTITLSAPKNLSSKRDATLTITTTSGATITRTVSVHQQ